MCVDINFVGVMGDSNIRPGAFRVSTRGRRGPITDFFDATVGAVTGPLLRGGVGGVIDSSLSSLRVLRERTDRPQPGSAGSAGSSTASDTESGTDNSSIDGPKKGSLSSKKRAFRRQGSKDAKKAKRDAMRDQIAAEAIANKRDHHELMLAEAFARRARVARKAERAEAKATLAAELSKVAAARVVEATEASNRAQSTAQAAHANAQKAANRSDNLGSESSLSSSTPASSSSVEEVAEKLKKKRRTARLAPLGDRHVRRLLRDDTDALIATIESNAPEKGPRRDSIVEVLQGMIARRVGNGEVPCKHDRMKIRIVNNLTKFLDLVKLTPRDKLASHAQDLVLLASMSNNLDNDRVSGRTASALLHCSRTACNKAIAARTQLEAIGAGLRIALYSSTNLDPVKEMMPDANNQHQESSSDDSVVDSDFVPTSSDSGDESESESGDDSDTDEEELFRGSLSDTDDEEVLRGPPSPVILAKRTRDGEVAPSAQTGDIRSIFDDKEHENLDTAAFSRIVPANNDKARARLLKAKNPFAGFLRPTTRKTHRSKHNTSPITDFCHDGNALGSPYLNTADLHRTKQIRTPEGTVEKHAILTFPSTRREMFNNFKRTSHFLRFLAINTRTVKRSKATGGGTVVNTPTLGFKSFCQAICPCVMKLKLRTCVQPRDENLEQALQSMRIFTRKRLSSPEVAKCECEWHRNKTEKIRQLSASKSSLFNLACCPTVPHPQLTLNAFTEDTAQVLEAANLEAATIKMGQLDYEKSLSLYKKPSKSRPHAITKAVNIPDAAFRSREFCSHHRRCLLGACCQCHYSSKLKPCALHFAITVSVTVKVMQPRVRAGMATIEQTKVEMNGVELFEHLLKCMEASGHDYFLSSWSRQNFDVLYQTFLPNTCVIAKDFAATMTAKPSVTVTAYLPWHMYSEMQLISYHRRKVDVPTDSGTKTLTTMETAAVHIFSEQNTQHLIKANYLFTTYAGIEAIKILRREDPLHFTPDIKHVIHLHDACAGEYRQRRTLGSLQTMLNECELESIEDAIPNAGGFKGPHDGQGKVASNYIAAAQNTGACINSAYEAFMYFHSNHCGPVETTGAKAPGLRPYRSITRRHCVFLVSETDATQEMRAAALAGIPIRIIDMSKSDWDTPGTISNIGEVYGFRVIRPPTGSPKSGEESFSPVAEQKLFVPKSKWVCAGCAKKFDDDKESVLPWNGCFACSATFCGACSGAGKVEQHDTTHQRSYFAQIRQHSCFCGACVVRGTEGICTCTSQVEAGRWQSVQVIKLHVALNCAKKARLASLVEFFGRRLPCGRALEFISADPAAPVVIAALLGGPLAAVAEEAEREVFLCLLVAAPYKLTKQHKAVVGNETTKFPKGSFVADVKIIGVLKPGSKTYQCKDKKPMGDSKVLAENLLVPENAIRDKKVNAHTYLPCTIERPKVTAAHNNPKFTLDISLVNLLLGLAARVTAAEEIVEGLPDQDEE